MMTKTEMLQVLARYLPPDVLSAFMKVWWQSGLEAQANGSASEPQAPANDEPLIQDCKWCGQAHDARYMDQCPLDPRRRGTLIYHQLRPYLDAMWIRNIEISPANLEKYYRSQGSKLEYSYHVLQCAIDLWKADSQLSIAVRNQWLTVPIAGKPFPIT